MGLKSGGLRGSLRNIGTGGSVILDSAVNQYRINEGSGATVADSIGTEDLTVNGPTWVSQADAVGGFELSFDGSNDYLNRTPDSLLSINTAFSIAFTCTPASTSREYVFANGNFNNHVFLITIDAGFVVSGFGENTSGFPLSNESSQSIDGSRQRYCVTYDGSSTTTTYVNAVGSSSLSGSESIRGTNADGNEFVFGRDNNGRYGNFNLDNPIVYDAELTASEVQDDLDGQPWS